MRDDRDISRLALMPETRIPLCVDIRRSSNGVCFEPLRMRRLSLLLAVALLLASGSIAHAEYYVPTVPAPGSYAEAMASLQELQANIDDVDCGGWNAKQGVPLASIGKAGAPQHLPGRPVQDPMGAPETGVGTRGIFSFPDSTFGYLSACTISDTAIIDDDLQYLKIPGIVWQWSGDPNDAVTFVEDPGNPGRIEINPFRWCLPIDGATPRLCEKLMETWKDLSAIVPRPPINTSPLTPSPRCICPPDALDCPVAHVPKHYCFDGVTASKPAVSVPCDGQDCRTKDPPYFTNQLLRCEWGIPQFDADGNYIGQRSKSISNDWEDVTTSSFYRHYGGRFQDWRETQDPDRSIIEVRGDGPNDRWKIRAECYGQYQEVDPRDTVMSPGAQQCELVVLSESEQAPRSPEWSDRQKEKTVEPDALPSLPDRPVPAPWERDDATALTLPDLQQSSASSAGVDLLVPLSTAFRVTRLRASSTTPSLGRTDTFSDDATRAFGRWWETQQRELLRLTRDPVTRLLLPPRAITGFDEDDPVFTRVRGIVRRSDGVAEATLRQGDDDIAGVVTSLLQAWIAPVQTVPVTAVVPRASLEDIERSIGQWRLWIEREDADARTTQRASRSADGMRILQRLEDYRTRLEEVRILRTALPEQAARFLELHAQIRDIVQTWYQRQAERLAASAAIGVERRALLDRWRNIQTMLLETDAQQLLWCSNQRFTAPIYSLLDLPSIWWGSAQPGMQRSTMFAAPDLTQYGWASEPDLEFDFSDMRVDPSALLLPVLILEDVPIFLPDPPLLGGPAVPLAALPPLPPLPDPALPAAPALPSVVPPQNGDLPPPPATVSLSQAMAVMDDIERLVRGMSAAYAALQPSVLTPPDSEQRRGFATKIIHVENDLLERTTRLFARWMPNRLSDLKGHVARLDSEPPPANDHVCHEDTVCQHLSPTIVTKAIWQWFVPDASSDLVPLAQSLVPSMIVAGQEQQNPFTLSIPDLRRLIPVLVPATISLSPSAP